MNTEIRKGQFVTYRNGHNTLTIEAIVRRAHRDGSATIEARHVLRGGKRVGCYLGYRFRLNNSDLTIESVS